MALMAAGCGLTNLGELMELNTQRYIDIARLGNTLTEDQVQDLYQKSYEYIESWEPWLVGSRKDTDQLDSWPRNFIGTIPLAVQQVQMLAVELIQQGYVPSVVEGKTVLDVGEYPEEVKGMISQMDALMCPFLIGSNFFEVHND